MGEKRKRPEEAVGFWEGGSPDGDVLSRITLPTHVLPGCGELGGQCGQDPDTRVPAWPRRVQTETAPGRVGTRRSGFSLPKEVPTGRLDSRGLETMAGALEEAGGPGLLGPPGRKCAQSWRLGFLGLGEDSPSGSLNAEARKLKEGRWRALGAKPRPAPFRD